MYRYTYNEAQLEPMNTRCHFFHFISNIILEKKYWYLKHCSANINLLTKHYYFTYIFERKSILYVNYFYTNENYNDLIRCGNFPVILHDFCDINFVLSNITLHISLNIDNWSYSGVTMK